LLPRISDRTFIDLGCGEGRALVIASEFPFRAIVGVELSPALCATATANAAVIANRFPDRMPIQIVQADAGEFVDSTRTGAALYVPSVPEAGCSVSWPISNEGVRNAGGGVCNLHQSGAWTIRCLDICWIVRLVSGGIRRHAAA
jgi:SAM-dependent methyltransferase